MWEEHSRRLDAKTVRGSMSIGDERLSTIDELVEETIGGCESGPCLV